MRVSYSLGSLLTVQDVVECAGMLAAAPEQPDTVWVPESWGAESYSILGMLSQRLARPRIGTSIVNVYSRSPALVAMGALTVDALSGGRMVVGLGASSPPIVERLHGHRFERPLDRMREYVGIVRSLTSCGRGSAPRVEHDGEIFRLGGFKLLARPVRDRMPIYLAAVGRRMAELAWDVGDGVIFYLRPPREIRETVSAMNRRRGGGGERFDVACQIVTAVSDDTEAALERAKKTLAFYVSVGDAYRRFLGRAGYASEAAAVREGYERGGLAAAAQALPDRMAAELAAYGTAEDCRRAVERFADAGVSQPIVQFNPVGAPAAKSFKAVLEAFSGAGA